jgi:hypothetical protein
MKKVLALLVALIAISQMAAASPAATLDDQVKLLEQAAQDGEISVKLSEPEEIKALIGEPLKENSFGRRDRSFLIYNYDSGLQIAFSKFNDSDTPFVLMRAGSKNGFVDLCESRAVVLRNRNDLKKLDTFWGLANVSVSKLDLRDQSEFLETMNFDSNTIWPEQSMLPDGFNPAEILEEGKNPGLGLRGLHEKGIDGTGVGLAIIDQPLLLSHQEYCNKLLRYDATGLKGSPVAMHSAPVSSIACGDNLGVAPRAALTFFACPMWEKENIHYIRIMEKIFALNEDLPENEKIRVVSISTGMFPNYPDFDRWLEVLRKADSLGICVVTCLMDSLKYGMIRAIPGTDHDNPANYERGKYYSDDDQLRAPTGNITVASHRGIDDYTFYRNGGLSWAAPYIAGVAALGYQVNPDIKPAEIIRLLKETAARTGAGPVINPVAFIVKVQEMSALSGKLGQR